MNTDGLARALHRLVIEAPADVRGEAARLRDAFETYASEDVARSDAWLRARLALRDSVTGLLGPAIVPLVIDPLFELALAAVAEPDWVARRIAVALDTARAWRGGDPDACARAGRIEDRVIARADAVLSWIGSEIGRLEDGAIVIARKLEPLQRPLVARIVTQREPRAYALLALAALPPLPDAAWDYAMRAIDDDVEERRVAAAILLQRHPRLDGSAAARVDDVLGPSPHERWGPLCDVLAVEILPLPMARFRGEMEPAEVLFVGERTTTIRRAGNRVSTVRAVVPSLAPGARVLVGVSPQGVVRALEHQEFRVEFDLRGDIAP